MKKIYYSQWIIGLLFALSLLPGTTQAQLADSAWPMFLHDVQHTGRSPFVVADSIILAWTFSPEKQGAGFSTPTISTDGTIYVSCGDGNLYALYPGGGLKWKYRFGYGQNIWGITSSPTVGADGTVYIGAESEFDGIFLFAITPDGRLRWKYRIGSERIVYSSPAIARDGTLYIGSISDTLYALNPDGTLKWEFGVGDGISSSPAIDMNGTIYFCSNDGYLYAVNPDGTFKWKYKMQDTWPFQESSASIGSDGTVYTGGSDNRQVFAINPDGSLKWSISSGGNSVGATPAIGSDGTLYIPVTLDLRAINPDGSVKWTFDIGNDNDASAVIDAQGTIYCSSQEKFFAINPDGSLNWMYDPSEQIISSPAIDSDGSIYFATSEKLYAFARPGTGLIPDLAISGIAFDPPKGTNVGAALQIRAAVQDLTGQAVARCRVSFFYGNTSNLIDSASVFVPAGRAGHAQVTWNTQNFEPQIYSIIAVISNSDPAESNTSNNEANAVYPLYATIQSRIDAAQQGDTVWVAGGTYFEHITLKRGVVVKSLLGQDSTIIDGSGTGNVVSAPYLDPTAVLDGFTIQNGSTGIDIERGGVTIIHNKITGNSRGLWMIGSFVYSDPVIMENLFIGNSSMAIDANNSWALVRNNTFANNGKGIHSIGFYQPSPYISNCIIWNNQDDLSGTAAATYSDIENGNSGFGNISLDPLFVDPANGDYRLQLTSPCLDAGDPTLLDADGTRSDMGAYPVFQGGGRFGAPINLTAMSESDSDRIILQWESPPPLLEVSVDNLTFDIYDLGWAFFLENTGLGRMAWTASTDQPWLTLLPDSGVAMLGRGQLFAIASRKNLAAGEYTGNILITSNGGNKTLPITLKVGNTPEPGKWQGTGISFTVSESMRRVRNLTFTKSSGNQSFKFEFNGSVPIDSNQTFTIVSGDVTIKGTFDSRKTVSGTYQIPFNPSPSGNWSANWQDGGMGKVAANSRLSGEIASDLQIIAGYNIYRRPATGSFDSVLASVSGNVFNYIDSTVVAGESYYYVVDAYDQNGQLSEKSNEAGPIVADIKRQSGVPLTFALSQNYPNPFNPETTIKYQLPKATEVKLTIYNLLGQRVASLVDKQQPAGYYAVKWYGKDQFNQTVASGVYLYRIRAGEFVKVRKLTLLR